MLRAMDAGTTRRGGFRGLWLSWGLLWACAASPLGESVSSGKPAPESPADALERKQAELAQAEARLAEAPQDEERLIWVGRRLAYLERFDEAQAVYTRALLLHPRSAKALRHRGHRWISLRRFDRAVADLSRAWDLCRGLPDEVEQDGQPNAAGIPIGTLQSNIVYHLALAHYLRGEFASAAALWQAGRELNLRNDDRLCSSAYWNHLALARAGDVEGARTVLQPVREPLKILENESYRDLCFLLKGELAAENVLGGATPGSTEFATRGYGVACALLLRGDRQAARELFLRIVEAGPKSAFGAIAAEVELAR